MKKALPEQKKELGAVKNSLAEQQLEIEAVKMDLAAHAAART